MPAGLVPELLLELVDLLQLGLHLRVEPRLELVERQLLLVELLLPPRPRCASFSLLFQGHCEVLGMPEFLILSTDRPSSWTQQRASK